MPKWNSKVFLVSGAVLAATLVSGVAMAATNGNGGSSTTQSVTAADSHTSGPQRLKALHSTEKQLDQEIRGALQDWKAAHPSPVKQLSNSQQAQLKSLRTQLKSLEAQIKSLKGQPGQVAPLRAEAKQIRAQIEALVPKSALQTYEKLVDPLKSSRAKIRALMSQRKAAVSVVKSARQAKDHAAVTSDLSKLVVLEQQVVTAKQSLLAALQGT